MNEQLRRPRRPAYQSAGSVTDAAQSQLRALQSTREGANGVSDGIKHSTQSLVAAGQLAGEAKRRAGEGEIVLDKARQSMNSIIESSRKIENIVGLIESIAFQTNLLALNAEIFEDMKSSSQAQKASMQRVDGHVRDLDRLSQHNLSLAESNNACAAELADNAERMQGVIARFSTGEPAVAAPMQWRRAG
ncbi:MAG: methyl-accepting chemotaxis protein [Gammaproteobacteria bacterium]